MSIFLEILGWVGTLIIIGVYALVSLKKMEAASPLYYWLNLIGASFLGVNVFYKKAWAAVFLEIVWGMIAIVALISYFKKSHEKF